MWLHLTDSLPTMTQMNAWNENGLEKDTAFLLNHQHICTTVNEKKNSRETDTVNGCSIAFVCPVWYDFLKLPWTGPHTDSFWAPHVFIDLITSLNLPPLFPLLLPERHTEKRWCCVLLRSENSASFWKGSHLCSLPPTLFCLSTYSAHEARHPALGRLVYVQNLWVLLCYSRRTHTWPCAGAHHVLRGQCFVNTETNHGPVLPGSHRLLIDKWTHTTYRTSLNMDIMSVGCLCFSVDLDPVICIYSSLGLFPYLHLGSWAVTLYLLL